MRKNQLMLPRPSRHRVRIPCQVVRLRDFKLVADCIENLSLGGILVGPADPVLTGEPLFLSFRLPCSQHWIDTEATVARVIHGRREGDQTRQLGIKFELLSPSNRDAVRAQLLRMPPIPPCSRPGRRDTASTMNRLSVGSGWSRSSFGHALIRWWGR
mgnify:CR=1 FL=1